MKATQEAESWMNVTVERILSQLGLPEPRRTEVERELRSQLFSAAETDAGRRGRTRIDVAELVAAHAASGGDEGLRRAFAPSVQEPMGISSRRIWIPASAFALVPVFVAAIAATIAITTYFGNALPGRTIILAIAMVVSAAAASMTVGALVHVLVRRDLARAQRIAWAVSLVALSVAAAAVYFSLGRQGSRRFADWLVSRFRPAEGDG